MYLIQLLRNNATPTYEQIERVRFNVSPAAEIPATRLLHWENGSALFPLPIAPNSAYQVSAHLNIKIEHWFEF